jgi:hypothetical protein
LEDFDPKRAILEALDARIERLEATREIVGALGFELEQVAIDIAACKEIRRRGISNWKKQAPRLAR